MASMGGRLVGVTDDDATVARAKAVSTGLLAGLGRRWLHVQAVAARAEELSAGLEPHDRATVVAAAWLHDIGYAPDLALTGLHPLDGATYLSDQGFPAEIVSLVAYHTGAEYEAEERGLLDQLRAFALPPSSLLDTLTAADMTVGPGGELVSAEERINEILRRYEPTHPVHRAVSSSAGDLIAVVARTLGE